MIAEYFKLEGKHVLITGSTRGIGEAFAKGFKSAGCEVWIHGREEHDCKRVAESLGAHWVHGDLEKMEEIDQVADKILKSGRLDILINNAAMEEFNPIEKFDPDLFDKIFMVNVKSAMILINKLLPLLVKSGKGNILNITSIHQEIPYPKNSLYSMSKAALGMLTKCLALELAQFNIRVNNLAPGAVRTDINKEVIDSMEDKFREWIPLGRVASTDEMIGSALYLCSDASSYATGATFFVDGGYKENIVRY
jgi:NAD(P)-dependent dehydrogenase (short-subunit alcohol dehydrogenase family)